MTILIKTSEYLIIYHMQKDNFIKTMMDVSDKSGSCTSGEYKEQPG